MISDRERQTGAIRHLDRPTLSGPIKVFDTIVKAFDPWDRIAVRSGYNSGFLERHVRLPIFRLRIFAPDDTGRCFAKVLCRRNEQGGIDESSVRGYWIPEQSNGELVRMSRDCANLYLSEFNVVPSSPRP